MKPANSAVGSDGAISVRKKRSFRAERFTVATSPRFTGHSSPAKMQTVCPTKLRVRVAKLDVRA